jgi:RNA polymerase sigma-70 factor (ECF subfamily)
VKAEGGSGSDFEPLAILLVDSLYNLARWLACDETEAEDLVQDAFTKALRRFSSFVPGTDCRAWTFRILRNTFLTSRTGSRGKLTQSLEEAEETGRLWGPQAGPNPTDRPNSAVNAI